MAKKAVAKKKTAAKKSPTKKSPAAKKPPIDAIVDAIERDDLSHLRSFLAQPTPLDDARYDDVMRALRSARYATLGDALPALAAGGFRFRAELDDGLVTALVDALFVEGNAAGIRTLGELGLRLDRSQERNCVEHVAHAEVDRALAMLDALPAIGFDPTRHPRMLWSASAKPLVAAKLLALGVDPSAKVDQTHRVYDFYLQEREIPRASMGTIVAHVGDPLQPAVIAQIERLGGTVSDGAGWTPGEMPRALWMLGETRWPANAKLRTDPDAYPAIADFTPRPPFTWSEDEGWGRTTAWAHVPLWAWGYSREDLVALEVGSFGTVRVHVLRHDGENDLSSRGLELSEFLRRLYV
jgi:hypothetical protein